jgi:hypothetical protein
VKNTVVEKIRRLLLNYDLTVAYALGEIKIRQEIMKLYKGDTRKPSQKKFVQAKIDLERYEVYVEEIVKAKKELVDNLNYVLKRYNDRYKSVFWLHCIEKKTYDEIVEKTGYSYEACKKICQKVKADIICWFNDEDSNLVQTYTKTKKRGRKKKAQN